ncbi:Transducin/WD40 repeat-like superfamily protein [Rhynchospora pubera]|uniref:Transducin/WD40 repeat-like superfamily protein n=1 Tax=Rhynchospora pubera TaxID=906938 RepID=A0AAV8E1B5_9POAL|nr:Transducin/WD40 repeat-like superfamily protein [Rhynchospora pubera]
MGLRKQVMIVLARASCNELGRLLKNQGRSDMRPREGQARPAQPNKHFVWSRVGFVFRLVCSSRLRRGGREELYMWTWKALNQREDGSLRPSAFRRGVVSSRASSLQLSNAKEFISLHRGAINSLEIDSTEGEGRYLLSAASDGTVAVFDTHRPTSSSSSSSSSTSIAQHHPLFHLPRAHKFAISRALWYPIDTGLFITASFDHYVKLWDTNSTQVVLDYKLPAKVYGIAMSSIATSHSLIATATADVQVRLCDLASGAFAHTLSGHRDGVMSLEWSSSTEFVLITGGCDGAIRFWDIRRPGTFLLLDQSLSQLGTRPSLLPTPTPSNNESTSLPASSKSSSSTPILPAQKRRSHKKIQLKPPTQSSHPGMASSQNRATAHYGAVNGLRATADGFYLLSSGSDSRLRLWDIESGRNTLVNYEAMSIQTSKPIQLAVTPDSSLVFVPCMASLKAYDLWSGTTINTYRGHYESVNCCFFNAQDQELYTGSNDRQILVWSPSIPAATQIEEADSKGGITSIDQDNWSD